ncbi:PREDICTED: uncharacterized protein LOC106804717 isoform X2 [Priapulus caudatus]|uniref:Uncharacterized protein LOC106804717 isoform X2 n=1 Tax=Priapulus caudatus TaxID=37621 RepID=A0ABM1DNH6_PRICU|nr:PREDICTED: uncharacterized protein LOC106804717 isoform X2 [Priapulus caudatus]
MSGMEKIEAVSNTSISHRISSVNCGLYVDTSTTTTMNTMNGNESRVNPISNDVGGSESKNGDVAVLHLSQSESRTEQEKQFASPVIWVTQTPMSAVQKKYSIEDVFNNALSSTEKVKVWNKYNIGREADENEVETLPSMADLLNISPAGQQKIVRKDWQGIEKTYASVATQTPNSSENLEKAASVFELAVPSVLSQRRRSSARSMPGDWIGALQSFVGVHGIGLAEDHNETHLLTTDNPPVILKYKRESTHPDHVSLKLVDDNITLGNSICGFCSALVKPFPSPQMFSEQATETLYCCDEYCTFVEMYISSCLQELAEEEAAAEREAEKCKLGDDEMNLYAMARNQLKIISYTLSSKKCIDSGWTITPSIPKPQEKPNLFHPLSQKDRKPGKFVQKFYSEMKTFYTLFPDGTGCIFYPSGNLAIVMSLDRDRQYRYVIQEDEPMDPRILAVFGTDGSGVCYNERGSIRLCLDQLGGSELDWHGNQRKRWFWRGMTWHCHAPPFQPITLSLNRAISVRVMSQENITVVFSIGTHTYRLSVGACLRQINTLPSLSAQDCNMALAQMQRCRTSKLLQAFADEVKSLQFLNAINERLILPKLREQRVVRTSRPVSRSVVDLTAASKPRTAAAKGGRYLRMIKQGPRREESEESNPLAANHLSAVVLN